MAHLLEEMSVLFETFFFESETVPLVLLQKASIALSWSNGHIPMQEKAEETEYSETVFIAR